MPLRKYILPAIITLTLLSVLIIIYFSATNKSSVNKTNVEDSSAQSNEPEESQPTNDLVGSSNSNNDTYTRSSIKVSGGSVVNSVTQAPQVLPTPEYTIETRNGQPLEEFPFEIMTDPPHSFHDPVTDFASVVNNPAGTYLFTLPETTSSLGLYGRFWLSPTPPTSTAKLAGVRFINSAWTGTTDDSLVVYSLLDRQTEDNALGTVTGAYQGLADQLVAVLFDTSIDQIELRLYEPVLNSGERFVLAIDSENLPTGNPNIIFPDTISVEQIQWLWTY